MDIIKALKENEKPFGLMSEEMQVKAKEIGHVKFKVFCSDDDWKFRGPDDEFGTCFTYRLRHDYEEKPEIVEYEVFEKDGHLNFKLPNAEHSLHQAVDDPDFIGFKYEGQYITPSPRLYLHKSGQAHDRVSSGYMAEYKVLTPIAVLFQVTK